MNETLEDHESSVSISGQLITKFCPSYPSSFMSMRVVPLQHNLNEEFKILRCDACDVVFWMYPTKDRVTNEKARNRIRMCMTIS